MTNASKVWIATELFHPEETSTGAVMTSIARGLAEDFDVGVVCAQPTYSARGAKSKRRETLDGNIDIRRILSTTFGRSKTAGRLADMFSITVSTLVELMWVVGRRHVVLVVTNPPLLPYVAVIAARLRGAKTVLVVHDMFPEVLALGSTSSIKAVGIQVGHWLSKWLYRSVDAIVVIGPDQADRLGQKMGRAIEAKVTCIPLAYDDGFGTEMSRSESEHFRSELSGLDGKVVFQFAGNMGPLQGGEFLVDAVSRTTNSRAHFNFVGAGRARGVFERLQGYDHVTLSDRVPRDRARDLHAGCDVIIVSLVEGMWGISVPSRISNALAAGKPILGIVDAGSTLDRLITEHDIGWSVRPGDIEGFESAVHEACVNTQARESKSENCLRLASSDYLPSASSCRYRELMLRLSGLAQ